MARNLGDEFAEKIMAGTPGILIKSYEHEEALREIRAVCRDPSTQWPLAVFDLERGMTVDEFVGGGWITVPRHWEESLGPDGQYSYQEKGKMTAIDCGKAITGMHGLTISKSTADGEPLPGILVILNFQRLAGLAALVQIIANRIEWNKSRNLHIVLMQPTAELPIELRRLFESGHIRHELPDREQIAAIINSVATEPLSGLDLELVVDAAAGLTRGGVEDATAISQIRTGRVDRQTIFNIKAEAFASDNNALQIKQGTLSFADYGGATFLKQFTLDLLRDRVENPRFRPKGVLLVGPPGVGKSLFANCLGKEVDRPIAHVTLGALKSKFQGASFENLLGLIETLEAMAPLIVFMDEIEGQISGGKDTGATDGGTTSQINSKLLSWMNDRTSDIFIVAACNDTRALMRDMPEFARMGRFDGLFFLDYPDRKSKDEIWKIHLANYELLAPDQPLSEVALPPDENWTGSEIEACCRLARLRKVPVKQIGATMPIIAAQASARIEEGREWASGRCFAAEYEALYDKNKHQQQLNALIAPALSTNGKRRTTLKQKPNLN